MQSMGCIPKEGDQFSYENLSITIAQTNDHRIIRVYVDVQENNGVKQ